MTPRERAIAALELRQPDDIVPTFELEFQLVPELMGRDFIPMNGLSGADWDRALGYNAELNVAIAEKLDYSIIRVYSTEMLQKLVKMGVNKQYLLCGEADGTMAIPDGEHMEELAYELFEKADDIHASLRKQVDDAKEWGAKLIDAGADALTMCADYCFNQGPFLSPPMFREFVTQYLADLIDSHRKHGAYVIKHTDGDIMPILDQLVECRPHALHSIDPQAKVDIGEVKRLYGDEICLCGNVNCALLQTGTDEEVEQSARYALEKGMPGGGYIYCTSNVAFRGMELERYLMILDIRKQYGRYDGDA